MLFVYGTLRKDCVTESAVSLMRTATYVGPATYRGKMYLLQTYPGAVPSAHTRDVVYGELYRGVSEHLLEHIDAYEECSSAFPTPHEYERVLQTVQHADGTSLLAWVYVYAGPTKKLQRITHGDFSRVRQSPAQGRVGCV